MRKVDGIGEIKMSGHEYVFIDQVVLDHPLEQTPPESAIAIINFVELTEAYDQLTVEVL